MKNIIIDLPKEENYNPSEGIYPVKVKDVFELDEPYKDQTSKSIKIKFVILETQPANGEYVVAKRYPASLAAHSELRKDLEAWLGPDAIEKLMVDGQVHLELLIGQKADAEVVHIHNPGYKNPFVYPKRILAPGTLTGNKKSIQAQAKAAPCIASLRARL